MKRELTIFPLAFILSACVQEMGIEGRILPYNALDNKPIARPLPKNTIARGQLIKKTFIPPKPDVNMVKEGRESYEIFCASCHGLSGYGDGIIVKRGFPAPPSFHQERIRNAPEKYLVQVIRDGFGIMYGFKDRLSVQEAWSIAYYLKALELSQNTHITMLPEQYKKDILEALP